MSTNKITAFVLAVLFTIAPAFAQSVSSPPNLARTFELTTSSAAAVSTSLLITPSSPTPAPGTRAPKSVAIFNDSAVDCVINLETTATAVVSNGGSNLRLKAGEKISLDGTFPNASVIRLTTDVTVRLWVSY